MRDKTMALINGILNFFTFLGFVCFVCILMFLVFMWDYFAYSERKRKLQEQQQYDEQHQREQVTYALAQIRLEVDATFKQDVMLELDRIFQEWKPDGDTDPQISIPEGKD